MRVVAWIGVVALHLVRLWLMLGCAVRLTGLRDFAPAEQVFFYSTPWLVQCVGFAALLGWDHWRGCCRWRSVSACLAGVALIGWLTASWRWAPQPRGERDFRIVLWNVARPVARFSPVVNYLRTTDADIIALAEWQEGRGGMEKWRKAFPGYQLQRTPGEMLLLARGEITLEETGSLGRGSFYGLMRVKLGGRECSILQADVYGSPFANRQPPLQRLTTLARERAGSSLILLGDLNTPRESRLLAPLRAHYRHAFETAGRGYAETWPMPLPVLGLDQVWVGAPFEVLRCEHGVSPFSDHRPVIVDLRWRAGVVRP